MSVEAISCRLCGASDQAAVNWVRTYRCHVAEAEVCFDCAERVANAFNYQHSGRWLTYPNLPLQKKLKASIPNSLRTAVFERDAYRCKHCDSHIDLTADHIVPESKGGETTLENLQTLCRSCNCKKGVAG
jgi:5-methylcytosine-specific restriction endonuclease McrA